MIEVTESAEQRNFSPCLAVVSHRSANEYWLNYTPGRVSVEQNLRRAVNGLIAL